MASTARARDRYDAARRIALRRLVALDYFRNREARRRAEGPDDYVTHADRDVENVIRRELAAAFATPRRAVTLRVASRHDIPRGMLVLERGAIGCSGRSRPRVSSGTRTIFEIRRRMMEAGVAMRNFGSAALQLAHVASGRLDGFIELQLSAWDAVAGLLLVEEAGGYHLPFAPAAPTAKAPCVACAPGIAPALTELVGPL